MGRPSDGPLIREFYFTRSTSLLFYVAWKASAKGIDFARDNKWQKIHKPREVYNVCIKRSQNILYNYFIRADLSLPFSSLTPFNEYG